MGTENEAAYPIEDFGGINLNADKEDLQPNQLLAAQNLWEPTLGVLETRPGSSTVRYKPSAVNALGLGKPFKIYKPWEEEVRFCPVTCTMDAQALSSLPTGISLSFETEVLGYWNNDNTFTASGSETGTTVSMLHPKVLLRFVGYGVDYWYEVDPTTVTGYTASTNQTLRVKVTRAFVTPNVTGIEVYARIKSGSTATSAAISNSSAYQEQTLWCGFMDINTPVYYQYSTLTPTVQNSTLYTVTINGTLFSYTSDATALAIEIVGALSIAINAGSEPVTATVEDNKLVIKGNVASTAFTVTPSANLAAVTSTDHRRDFRGSPAGFRTGIAAGTTLSSTERSFTVYAFASGTNGVSGDLVGGKTYYVAVLPQYTVFDTGTASRSVYRNHSVNVAGGEVVAVTIPGSSTGYLRVNNILPNTMAFIVCVGETPHTLQPIKLFNNSWGGFYFPSTPPTIGNVGDFFITETHRHNPGLIDLTYTGVGIATLSFRMSDYSRQDTLMRIDDDGGIGPIFISRIHAYAQDVNQWEDVVGNSSTSLSASRTPWVKFSVSTPTRMRMVGNGSKFNFIQWDSYAFFVNDYDPLSIDPVVTASSGVMAHKTNTNYYITDGLIAGTVIQDAISFSLTGLSASAATATINTTLASTSFIGQTATVTGGTSFTTGTYTVIGAVDGVSLTFSANVTSGVATDGTIDILVQLTLPNMKYISKFDSSVILGGGVVNVDPKTGLKNDSSKTLYFSRALNPFDFTIAGAASGVHQTVSQASDGENISGFGIYTNTSTNQGPLSQLVTAKKSCLWILSGLPVVTDGELSQATNQILSSKVGGVNGTFANTPIGTIVASYDNVYLLRESGEPTPIGQAISSLLKGAKMANAVACYHDKHYKLAFSHSSYAGYNSGNSNNVELWLNINKMIEKKGSEDWVGPMIGRAVDGVFVEDRDVDGDTADVARDRYAIDNYLGRIYIADYTSVSATEDDVYDLQIADGDASDTVVTSILTTKDFDITTQDNNWVKLLKRFYVKCRTNFATSVAANCSYQLHIDGVAQSAVNFGTSIAANSTSFTSVPLSLVRIFPSGRLRGRTFRLTFTFVKRVAIGGLQVNYKVERRRL